MARASPNFMRQPPLNDLMGLCCMQLEIASAPRFREEKFAYQYRVPRKCLWVRNNHRYE